ncbi:MAG: DUF4422 domain-containing protein [Agathobacter sp.]|nr:DUF4422 domain-containing protein [Agathobacter sp.]
MKKEGIYIFGAHSRGKTVAHYLTYLYPEIFVEAYLVDNDEINEKSVDGIPVICVNEDTKLYKKYPVYIGTRGVFHSAIIKHLEQIGMEDIRPVTVELDLWLRNEYLKLHYERLGRTFIKINDLQVLVGEEGLQAKSDTVGIYVAKSIQDKILAESYILQSYEKEIQVGAALTKSRLSNDMVTDDTGENISTRNKQFCELTALYWIWKNAKEDIVGLVHYRRHFMMPGNWLLRMKDNDVDAILPVPLYVVPNLEENYRSRHDESDLDYMFAYMKKYYSEDYEELKEFWQTGLYSPCNMLVARKDVLGDLCEWLFPILFEVVQHGGQKEDLYLNRYPGFLSERLISYFFEKNRNKYKVVFADKNFLQ